MRLSRKTGFNFQLIILLVYFNFFPAFALSNSFLPELSLQSRSEVFESNFQGFIETVDTGLALRESFEALTQEIDNKLTVGAHLTAKDQLILFKRVEQYEANLSSFHGYIATYNQYTDPEVEITFPASESSVSTLGDQIEIEINPNDDIGRLMILEIKMLLAARMMIYDNYLVLYIRYLKKSESRRNLNTEFISPKIQVFLNRLVTEFEDDELYLQTGNMVNLVRKIRAVEMNNPASTIAQSKDNKYLNNILDRSYTFTRIPELSSSDYMEISTAITKNEFFDEVSEVTNAVGQSVSGLFGNLIGLYEERNGKLYDMPSEERENISQQLRPLDILLEKTPFRLTDNFIPGHWGHVAIWVGGEDDIPELKRLGVWDRLPDIEKDMREKFGYEGPPVQQMIMENRGVLEALRDGVQMNSFDQFLNIDDLAVIRQTELDSNQKRKYLISAFSQLGKEYDFNFDIETSDKIVCSELAYKVFYDVNWPVEATLGRFTVSPDHIAAITLTQKLGFQPVLIYHDGKKLPQTSNLENLGFLLAEKYESVIYID